MKRILYVSQLADPADPRRATAPSESDTVPPLLRSLGVEAHVHDATLSPPPDPRGYDGVIVGGSFGSANDEEPWRVVLREWLGTHPTGPLFGICGGHQLLARALGGVVEVSPGPQFGVFPLELPGVPGFTARVLQLHNERVATPPPGAEVWATDDMGIQALRYAPDRWTVQFHPEMDASLAKYAGGFSGLDESDWGELDDAIRGGRALLVAWLATL